MSTLHACLLSFSRNLKCFFFIANVRIGTRQENPFFCSKVNINTCFSYSILTNNKKIEVSPKFLFPIFINNLSALKKIFKEGNKKQKGPYKIHSIKNQILTHNNIEILDSFQINCSKSKH